MRSAGWLLLLCAGCTTELPVRGPDPEDAATSVADAIVDSVSDATSADVGVGPDGDACAVNACGGCSVLTGAPGESCGGKCGTAHLACDGLDRVVCIDPVTTPEPGVACSVCGTVDYTCAEDGASTTCSRPDDTGPGIDFSFTAKELAPMPRLLERTREHLLFFKARSVESRPLEVTLTMRRLPYVCPHTDGCASLDARCACALDAGAKCACTVTSSIDDPIEVTYWKGSSPETPSHLLGGALVDSGKISDVAAPVTIALAGSGDATEVSAGDDVFLQIFTDSSRYMYELYGAETASEAPPDYRDVTRDRWPFTTVMVPQPGRPNLITTMWGCFP